VVIGCAVNKMPDDLFFAPPVLIGFKREIIFVYAQQQRWNNITKMQQPVNGVFDHDKISQRPVFLLKIHFAKAKSNRQEATNYDRAMVFTPVQGALLESRKSLCRHQYPFVQFFIQRDDMLDIKTAGLLVSPLFKAV
jgi:hypothetical protein